LRVLTPVLLAGLLSACLSGPPPLAPESVEEREVVEFAERVSRFYRMIEDRPLDSVMVYEGPELRAFFDDPREFSDYYASLANQVRSAHFRRGRAERVRIEEFRFDEEDLASVDVMLVGRHERTLRFWEIELRRTDVWRRIGGVWMLSPEKL
jgi:hypothetical protein